ncbi:MAG: two pore domain potassium channel family protein [Armatimonadetes bacterium]|nr:two pore domain potassium channel family protein [Armatimonadota bacterium]
MAFPSLLAAAIGLFVIILTLWEGFETVVLPRSVTRPLRVSRQFYKITWPAWKAVGMRLPAGSGRQQFLGVYGPISLPLLLGLWAILLIVGFALLGWALDGQFNTPERRPGFGTALYASGVTFFTLGYGDVTPRTGLARFVAVTEAGVGFGFLALVIGYLPVLYQAFSRREATISRLDARASSPATAAEMLHRYSRAGTLDGLAAYLRDWEQWASEILESHLSYPVLTYYRSQHEHQSWLGALLAIMDTCTLIIVGFKDAPPGSAELKWQAQMTYAMARHTIIDLAYVFNARPRDPDPNRLPPDALARLRARLAGAGLPLCDGAEDDAKLHKMRAMYEPYFCSLADFLAFPLPAWLSDEEPVDNWQTSAWDHSHPHF